MAAITERRKTRAIRQKGNQKIYIALEFLDFVWCESDVRRFEQMWKQGMSVLEIADELGRDVDEVIVLAIDRAKLKKIKPRPGGLLGEQAVVRAD